MRPVFLAALVGSAVTRVRRRYRVTKRLVAAIAFTGAFTGALLGGALAALSAEQTVTLSVNMWCPSCPYIIKRTLAKVPGVLDVEVSYDDQVAIVRFDDETTDVATLTQATADVGFPSEPVVTN